MTPTLVQLEHAHGLVLQSISLLMPMPCAMRNAVATDVPTIASFPASITATSTYCAIPANCKRAAEHAEGQCFTTRVCLGQEQITPWQQCQSQRWT
jgi:hypothetical protein